MLTLAYLTALLLFLTGRRVLIGMSGLSDRALTCVGGYWRRSLEDPLLEITLREAFAEFDRALKAYMHD